MKKILILTLLLTLFLSGCDHSGTNAQASIPFYEPSHPETSPAITQPSAPTQPSQPTEPLPTEPIPTEPLHSEFYIPGVSVEDVILYFNEVCLDAEFVNGGDPSVLQKWDVPIHYILHGDWTEEDITVLSDFTEWLNTIEGFPGIYETQDPANASLRIHFCSQSEMLSLMGEDYVGMDGAVTYWYMDNKIYDAIICYRTDLNQYVRNSVILEEIYNGLGPIQDTSLRPDSIIYSAYSEPQCLTEIDALLLKLLYHPALQCGMNAAECEAVIRQLYY